MNVGPIVIPASSAPSIGAWTLVTTLVGANSASLVYTGFSPSAYINYICIFTGVVPDTNGADFYVNLSNDGGVTYPAQQSWGVQRVAGGPAATFLPTGANNSKNIILATDNDSTSAGSTAGSLTLSYNGTLSTDACMIDYRFVNTNSGTGIPNQCIGAVAPFTLVVTKRVNTMKFLMNVGLIAKATFRIYGIT